MKNNKWISAAVKQPRKRGRYLVMCEGIRSVVIRKYNKGWWSMQPVTHWHPLPEKPKEIIRK